MNQTEILVKKITEGIQEKKGQKIIVADLTEIEDTICNYFVICQGNSPTQVSVIADSVRDYVRVETGNKPSAIDGLRNAQWVAMDYSDVLVHIFLPEVRTFYNLENLWADAKLTHLQDNCLPLFYERRQCRHQPSIDIYRVQEHGEQGICQ